MSELDFEDYLKNEITKDPSLSESIYEEKEYLNIALQLYKIRKFRNITHAQLAEKTGLKQANIARWEDSSYTGYTLSKLIKVVRAMKSKLHIRIVPDEFIETYTFNSNRKHQTTATSSLNVINMGSKNSDRVIGSLQQANNDPRIIMMGRVQ